MPEKRRLQSTARSAAGERRSVLASPGSNVAQSTATTAADLAALGRYVLAEAWRRTSEDVLARRPGSADSARHHGIDEVGA
ncbi:MAG: hypothetical protein IPM13_15130 [Phycisphaerales bacterium]|nr:hypothetical protein [Phycisphaerales bacterium]